MADFEALKRDFLAECEDERRAASHRREELATRAGAYLEATEPGATVVLGGLWAYAAQELSEMAEIRVIAINPPSGVKESETVGLVRVGSEIPLAAGSVLGVALDAWFPAKIVETIGGYPALELTVTSVKPDGASPIDAPASVRNVRADVVVKSEKVGEGLAI